MASSHVSEATKAKILKLACQDDPPLSYPDLAERFGLTARVISRIVLDAGYHRPKIFEASVPIRECQEIAECTRVQHASVRRSR